MRRVVKIAVTRMWESCQRTTYYVELTTDEGYSMTPDGFATGSVYTNFEGLSVEEARDRAITTAYDWGDFLELPVEPYIEDGVRHEPTLALNRYTTRRELKKRQKGRTVS